MQRLKTTVIAFAIVAAGCASKAPPSLSPAGVKIWQANEALLVLDMLQKSAIGLNDIQRCEAPPSTTCRPLLADNNTRVVIDVVADAVRTIRKVPDGWKATASAALSTVATRLDAAGKTVLSEYLKAANTILTSIA